MNCRRLVVSAVLFSAVAFAQEPAPAPAAAPPPPGAVPSCAEAGVFGVLPAVVGSLMAAEALKVLLGIGKPLAGHLLLYDALEASFRKLTVRRNPRCPVCGDEPTQRELVDYEAFCGLR